MTDLLEVMEDNNIVDVPAAQELETVERQMTEVEARDITEAIKSTVTATYILLARAKLYGAHKALGYDTWSEFVVEEFQISPQRSYQLINQNFVISELESSAPEGTKVELKESQTREIKKFLPQITERVKEETEGKTPEESKEIIDSIVEDVRKQNNAEDLPATNKTEYSEEKKEKAYDDGLQAAADKILESDQAEEGSSKDDFHHESKSDGFSSEDMIHVNNFFSGIATFLSLPAPGEMVKIVPKHRTVDIEKSLLDIAEWSESFLEIWKNR